MDAFALPLAVFTAGMVWLLVEVIRGSFEDPYPRRAGVTWAITCPVAGLLFGIGLAPIAMILGVVSMLALGSLGYWFLYTEPDDFEDESEAELDPDPGPSDDIEIPAWAQRQEYDWEKQKKPDVDWDAFDRARTEWEKETTPSRRETQPVAPARERDRDRDRELVPAGV